MRLLLARHGETLWNVEDRLQGGADVPLTERGRAQAAQLAHRLQDEAITAIYSSDLQRASATAAIVAAKHGLPVQFDPLLREQTKGRWEGLTFAEVEVQDPDGFQCWQADRGTPMGGGEDLATVGERIGAALDAIRAAHTDDEVVLVVSHGMVLRTMICLALGIDPMVAWQMDLYNTGVSELRFTPEWAVLVRLNDMSHTDGCVKF